jgi:mannose-6-phosphate isomerase-like protein (cupin superfamily)
MADVTVKKADELEAGFGGGFKYVRHGLGVTSFGIQLIELPPNADQYPEHDHEHDGQEEVYTALSGKATMEAGGQSIDLVPGTFVRVGPAEKRKIVTAGEGCQLLAIGGKPGEAYEVSAMSRPQEQPA